MHRIDSEGSINNQFSEGNPSLGVEGTKVTADFLNALQEELAYTIESAGLTLEKGNHSQLANAILTLVGGGGSFPNLETRITQLNSSYLYGARNIFRQNDEPLENVQGPFYDNDIWIETDQSPERVWVWNSITETWIDTTSEASARGILSQQKLQAISDGVVQIFIQTDTPTGASEGDLWYNDRDDLLFTYDAGVWFTVYDEFSKRVIVDAIIREAANTAQGTADSKILTYYQTSAPVGLTAQNDGDIWFDTSDSNKVYRYAHPTWIAISDLRIQTALDYIFLQGAIADGTIFVYFSADEPTQANQAALSPPKQAPSEGDVWVDITDDGGSPRNDVYLFNNNVWVQQTDPDFIRLLLSFASARAISDGAVTIYFSPTAPDDTFIPAPAYGDIWFDTSTVSIPDVNAADPATAAQINVTKWEQYRYDGTSWVVIADFKVKIIEANLKSEQFARTAEDTAISGEITTAVTRIGENEATVQQSLVSINGIAGAYGVRTNVNNKVVGFGFITDYEREIEFTNTGSLDFNPGDEVFLGVDYANKTYAAVIVSVDNVNETMRVISESGTFATGVTLASRYRLLANATIDAGTLNPTPGDSEFEIIVDKFKITDGTSSLTPFSISGGVVYVGALDTSVPQVQYIGEFASDPATTYPINSIYKNTTNGNTYVLEYITGTSGPKQWAIFLERGTNARSLVITANVPGYMFDSNAASSPTNPTITFNVQYQGQASAITSTDIVVTDKDDNVIAATLTSTVTDDTVIFDAGGTTHRGSFKFDIAYTEFAANEFPITITVDDGTLSDTMFVPRIIGSTAKLISLNPDSSVFLFEDDVATVPENASIHFRIQHQSLSTAPTTSELTIVDDAATSFSSTNFTSAGSGSGVSSFELLWSTVSAAVFPITVTIDDESINDVIVVRKLIGGVDAVAGFLTNESHLVPAEEDGTIVVGGLDDAIGTFDVYRGITKRNTDTAYTVLSTIGCSATIDDTAGGTAGNYAITAMAANKARAVFQAVYDSVTITKVMSLTKSLAGVGAKALYLFSDAQTFEFTGDNQAKDGGAVITLSTIRTGVSGITWTAVNELDDPVALSGTGDDTRTLPIGNFAASEYVTVTVAVTIDTVEYSDKIRIVRLVDGSSTINVVLSNESHTFFADENGVISGGDYDSGNSLISVYRGTEVILYQGAAGNNKFRFGTITASAGITIDGGETAPTVGISAMTNLFGYIDVPVIYRNNNGADTTYTKRISYAKSREGELGRNLQLYGTGQVFRFDGDNIAINPSDTITITAFRQHLDTDPVFTALNDSAQSVTLTGTGDSRALSITDFGTSEFVKVTCVATYTVNAVEVEITDTFSIYRIKGAIAGLVVLMTNENHTFFAGPDGTIDAGLFDDGNCTVRVFRGSEEISYDVGGGLNTFSFGTIVASNVIKDVTETAPEIGVSSMSGDAGSLTVPVIYKDPTGNDETITRVISYSKAKVGAQARGLRMSATSQIFRFDGEGVALNGADEITLTTQRTLLGDNPTWTAINQAGGAVALSSVDADTKKVTIANFGSSEWVRVSASITTSIDGNSVTYRDEITIVRLKRGTDAITALIENESHIFPSDENGVVSDYTSGDTIVRVFLGDTEKTYGTGNEEFRFGTITPTNVTNANLTAPAIGVSAMTEDTGRLRLPIIYRDVNAVDRTVYKEITYVKSRAGVAARNLRLFATKLVFEFDSEDSPVNGSDSIVFTAVATNVSNLTFAAEDQNEVAVALTGSGNQRTLAITAFDDAQSVSVTASGTSMIGGVSVGFSDTITIVRLREGAGGVQVSLTNESHTFYADEENAVIGTEYAGGNSIIKVYAGTTEVNYNASVVPGTWRLGTVTPTDVTRNGALALPIIGISDFVKASNTGILLFEVIYTDLNSVDRTIQRAITYSKSKAGTDARALRLIASSQLFNFNTSGQPVDNADEITLNAVRQFIDGTAAWTAVDEDSNNLSLTSGANGDEKILSIANFGSANQANISVSAVDSFTGETLVDTLTIYRLNQGSEGKDGVTVFIGNDNHSFPADEAGLVDDYSTANTTVVVYSGSVAINYSATKVNNTFRFGTMTPTNVTRNVGLVAPIIGISAMSDTDGSLTVPVIFTDNQGSDLTFTKIISYTKSLAGTNVRNIRLRATSFTFEFDQFGDPIDTNQIITFSSLRINVPSATWTAVDQNDDAVAFTSSPDADTRTLDIDDIGSATEITVSVSSTYNAIDYIDTIRVVRLDQARDSITIVGTNENHSFFADEGGVILVGDYASGDCTFSVYHGTRLITYQSTAADDRWRFGVITANSVTKNAALTGGATGITAMSANVGNLTVPIVYRDKNGQDTTYTKIISYTKSRNGRDARWVQLAASEQVFRFTGDDLPLDNVQTVSINVAVNLVDTGDVVVTAKDELGGSITLGGSGVARTMTISQFGNSEYAVVEATASITVQGQAQVIKDTITIGRVRNGSGVVQALLTNESHSFAADEDGVVSSYGGGDTDVRVFRGSEEINYQATAANNKFRFGTYIVSNVTSNGGLTKPAVGISAMSSDFGTLTIPIIYRDPNGDDVTINKVVSYSKSRAGNKARLMRLYGTGQVFKFNQDGNPVNGSDTITLNAISTNLGVPTWTAVDENSVNRNTLLLTGATDYQKILNIANFIPYETITVTASATHDAVNYSDQFTVYKVDEGASNIVVALSNEAHIFGADEEGVVSDYDSGDSVIRVFRGATEVSYNAGGADDSFLVNNFVATDTTRDGALALPSVGISAMSEDAGTLSFDVVYTDSVGSTGPTQTKTISYSKARAGVNARAIRLFSSSMQFNFDAGDSPLNGSDSIAFDAIKSFLPGTVTWTAKDQTAGNITLTGTGNSRALSVTNFGSSTYVDVKASVSDTVNTITTVYEDQIRVVRVRDGASGSIGADALQVFLTNPQTAFALDGDGKMVESYLIGNTDVEVYLGTTAVSYSGTTTANTWRYGTFTETNVKKYQSSGTVGISDMFADQGSLSVQIIYRTTDAQDIVINRTINYSKIRSGVSQSDWYLIPTKQTFAFDGDDNAKNGSDTITANLTRSASISEPVWTTSPSITLSAGTSVDQKIITIGNFGANEIVDVKATSSEGKPVYSNNYNYDFDSSIFGWQISGAVTQTINNGWAITVDDLVSTNQYVYNDLPAADYFAGADYRYMAVEIEVISSNGTGQKRIYWSTAGHSYASSNYTTANIQDADLSIVGTHTLIFDLHNPTVGSSTDFSGNTIRGIRFDPYGADDASFVIKRIGLATAITYFEDNFTISRIIDGTNNIQVIGSNESHTYKADEDGVITVAMNTGNCVYTLYRGSNVVSYSGTTTNNTWRWGTFTTTSGTITASYSGSTVTPTVLGADTNTLDVQLIYRDPNGVDTTFTRTLSWTKARQGVLARTLKITASSLVFEFDQDANAKNGADYIDFDVNVLNLSSPYTWTAVDQSGSSLTLTTVDSNTSRLTIANFGTSTRATITASRTESVDGSNKTYTDSVTVGRIQDASNNVVVIPTNESHTFFANEDGYVTDYSGGVGTFVVYRGLSSISYSATPTNNKWRYGTIVPIGISHSVVGADIITSNMTLSEARIDVPVIYRDANGQDYTYNQRLSFAKAIQGFIGAGGISIFQTNPTHVFTTDQAGALLPGIAYSDGDSTFSVYAGDEELTHSTFPKLNSFTITNTTPSNVTQNGGLSLPTIGISALSADSGNITSTIVAYQASTRVYNFGFEKGIDGTQTTTGPIGWLYSGSTNNVGYVATVDSNSNFNSTLSWGSTTSTSPFGSCGWYRVGKRFGVQSVPSFITMTAKVRPSSMLVPASVSVSGTQVYLAEDDCYAEVIFRDINNAQIGSTVYSKSLSHQLFDQGEGGQSYNGVWTTFTYTNSSVPVGTEAIEIYLVSSEASNSVQTNGYRGSNSGVLFDDFQFASDAAIYDITLEREITQTTLYTRSKTGQNSVLYYIQPTTGTAIKNGVGSLTGELHKVDGPSDVKVTSGNVKLYQDGVLITSPTNYAYSLNSAAITGSTLIEAKDGATVYDTISLLDVKDALGGGYITANNGLVMQRVSSEASTVTPSTSTLVGTFYRAGDATTPYTKSCRIEGRVSAGALQLRWVDLGGSSDIASVITRDSASSATSGTWYTTTSLTVSYTFSDPVSGGTSKVVETVYIISAGVRGSRQFYGTNGSWSDTVAVATITAAGLVPVLGDVVTLSTTGFAETRFYDGVNWSSVAQVINGNLVVQGTMAADRIASGLIDTANIQLGSSRFSLNAATENMIIQDENGYTRVKIGDLGAGASAYGIEIRDSGGNLVLSSGGLASSFVTGTFDWDTFLDGIPEGVTGAAAAMDVNGNLAWGNINGTGRPADDATLSRAFRQGTDPVVTFGAGGLTTDDTWFNTGNNKHYRWSGTVWQEIGHNILDTSLFNDDAGLGTTATWASVSGSGRPADNATVGARAGVNLTDHTGGAVSTLGSFARLVGTLNISNITTYIAGAAIDTALIRDAAIVNAKIFDLEASKITAGTIDVNINIGSANISLDGVNNRILISD